MDEFSDQLYLASGQVPGVLPWCQCQSCEVSYTAKKNDFRHFIIDLRAAGWSIGYVGAAYTFTCPACAELFRARVRAAVAAEPADDDKEDE